MNYLKQSLGRNLKLGDIYDIKTDSFKEINIFTQLPKHYIDVVRQSSLSISYFNINNLQEKLNIFFGEDDNQKISLISNSNGTTTNLINYLSNSGGKFDLNITGSLIYKKEVKTESFTYTKQEIFSILKEIPDLSTYGEHFIVTSIKYGQIAVATLENVVYNDEKRESLQNDLKKKLNKIVENQSFLKLQENEKLYLNSLSTHIVSSKQDLTSLDSIENYLSNLPTSDLIPLEFNVIPLHEILKLVSNNVTLPTTLSIEKQIVNDLVSEFGSYLNSITRLEYYKNVKEDLQNFITGTNPDVLPTITQVKAYFQDFKLVIRDNLENLGQMTKREVKDLIFNKTLGYLSSTNVGLENLFKRLDFIVSMQQNEKITVLSNEQTKQEILNFYTPNFTNIYILNYKQSQLSKSYLNSFMNFYYRKISDWKYKTIFLLLDLDLFQTPNGNTTVEFYHNSSLISTNYNLNENTNFIQYNKIIVGDTLNTSFPTRNDFICPGYQCSSGSKTWTCAHCFSTMKFQYVSSNVYNNQGLFKSYILSCSCGISLASEAKFKCSESVHDKDPKICKASVYLSINGSYLRDNIQYFQTISSNELVQLPANLKLTITSSTDVTLDYERLLHRLTNINQLNDIKNSFGTGSYTKHSLLSITSYSLENKEFSHNYLANDKAICFILPNDETKKLTTVQKIKDFQTIIRAYRTRVYVINTNPKNVDGEIVRSNGTLFTSFNLEIPIMEYFFDFEGLRTLIQSPQDKFNDTYILMSWRSLISEFNLLYTHISVETINSTPFAGVDWSSNLISLQPSNLKGTAKFLQGTLQQNSTGTITYNVATNPTPSTSFLSLQQANLINNNCGGYLIKNNLTQSSFVLKFDFCISNRSATPQWADGFGIVFANTGTEFFSSTATGGNLGYQTILTTEGLEIFSESPFTNSYLSCNYMWYNTTPALGFKLGNIPNARNQIFTAYFIYGSDNTISFIVNGNFIAKGTKTILGVDKTILALCGGSGSYKSNQEIANIAFK